MSQLVYRANLGAKSWPLVSEFFGRSVIMGSATHDQNFNRQTYSSEDPDKDVGIPQVYYAHNVMATSQGLQSIGYVTLITGPSAYGRFISIFDLHFTEGSAYIAFTDAGEAFTLTFGSAPIWNSVGVLPGSGNLPVSVANINGKSYIYVSTADCYVYDPVTNTVAVQALAGLSTADVLGIAEAVGYMIAYTTSAIAWSSALDPTDFVPSLATGAGGGAIQEAKGPINFIVGTSSGFILYTQTNAVAALYSGNARYPFNFKELQNCGGVSSIDTVAKDENSQWAYTTSGLQTVSSLGTQIAFPEVSDFLSGKYFEDFDEVTNTFISTPVVRFKKLVTLILNRYLVLSYGVDTYTHALVYDTQMKRWGKLKVTHVACFEYILYPAEVSEITKQAIGFLTSDGTVKRVDFSYADIDAAHSGVLLLGKYQLVRNRFLTLQKVELENIYGTDSFKLMDLPTIDGKTYLPAVAGYLGPVTSTSRSYSFRTTAINHTLVCTGAFSLSSLQLTFSMASRTR